MPNKSKSIEQISKEYLENMQEICREKGIEAAFQEYIALASGSINESVLNAVLSIIINARNSTLIIIHLAMFAMIILSMQEDDEYNNVKIFAMMVAAFKMIQSDGEISGFISRGNIKLYNQGSLALQIATFCNEAEDNGKKLFAVFTEQNHDSSIYNEELKKFKAGICLGLSALFIQASFITDRQENQKHEHEDDLSWFFKCVVLLQLPPNSLTSEQKSEVARFISLTLHLHNMKLTPNMSVNLFQEERPTFKLKQFNHIKNSEFTGNNTLEFDDRVTNLNFRETLSRMKSDLLEERKPAYILLILHTERFSHACSLHKDKDGIVTYYDPNIGIMTVKMSNEDDLRTFLHKVRIDYAGIVGVCDFDWIVGRVLPTNTSRNNRRF